MDKKIFLVFGDKMAKPWSAVENSVDYQQLSQADKMLAKQQYFAQVISPKPEYQALNEVEKRAAGQQFLGISENTVPRQFQGQQGEDIRAIRFIPQMTKALNDNIPFGKRIVSILPNANVIKENMNSTPAPQSLSGNLGSLVGTGLAYTPGFEVGAAGLAKPALTGAAKLAGMVGERTIAKNLAQKVATRALAGGSLGVGVQDTGKAKSEGVTNLDALASGVSSAAGTFVGGKFLEGVGKAVVNTPNMLRSTSARMNDIITKLPKSSFSYAKNPMEVFTKENIVGNTIHDYANKAGQHLEERVSQLNESVKNNPNFVNLKQTFDDAMTRATNLANASLKDRSEVLNGINEFKAKVAQEYGDLNKVSIKDAVRLKRQIAEDFPFNPLESKASTNNILSKIGHEVHHNINTKIEEVAPEITDLNQRVSGLIDIKEAAKNRAIVEARNNPVGLIGTIVGTGIAGGGLGAIGGQDPIKSGIGAVIALKVLSSPAVLSRVAKALSKMADVDKINVFKAYPWLLRSRTPDIQKQAEVLRLPAPEAEQPKYIQERMNAPIPGLDALATRGTLDSPVQMGAPKEPLALPSPLPEYLKQRQDMPIPSLGVKAQSNVLQPMKEPILLSKPMLVSKEAAANYQMLLRDARLSNNLDKFGIIESKMKSLGIPMDESLIPKTVKYSKKDLVIKQLETGIETAKKQGNLEAAKRYEARINELQNGGKVRSLNDLLKKENIKSSISKKLMSNKGEAYTGGGKEDPRAIYLKVNQPYQYEKLNKFPKGSKEYMNYLNKVYDQISLNPPTPGELGMSEVEKHNLEQSINPEDISLQKGTENDALKNNKKSFKNIKPEDIIGNNGGFAKISSNFPNIPTKTYSDMGDTASHWVNKNGRLIQGGSEEGHMAVWENNLKELGFSEKEAIKLIQESGDKDFEKVILDKVMEKGNIRVNVGKNKSLGLEIGELDTATKENLKKILENNQNYAKINIDLNGKPIAEGNSKQVLSKLNEISSSKNL